MPVIHRRINAENRPSWFRPARVGMFWVPRAGGRFDRHYHDCDEYWLFYSGLAKVMTEGRLYYVRPGDIVCTKAGDEHDVVEIYEDLAGFFFEDALPAGGKPGHLHRDPGDQTGHDVPAMPVPEDFPGNAAPLLSYIAQPDQGLWQEQLES